MRPKWQGLGKVQFSKWQGLGNDYIVLHVEELPWELTPERVRLLCDRNVGIGSDGILLVGPKTGEDRYGLRIFNPDGSEAEMCGNGVRMVARKLRMEGLLLGDQVVLETGAGEIVPRLGPGYEVTVDMGIARFGGEKLSDFDGDAVEETLQAAGRSFVFTFVDVGNPHAVIQSPWPLELVPLHEVGPMIEEHRFFPRKANVEFVKVIGEHEAKVRVWERGVGETQGLRHRRHGHGRRPGAHGGVLQPGHRRAAGRQAGGGGAAGLAGVHDRSGRGDLPRRPVPGVP